MLFFTFEVHLLQLYVLLKLMALKSMSVSSEGEGNGSLKFSEEGSGSLRTSKGKIHSTSSPQPRALQVAVELMVDGST
jgi:hypothetical protein